MTSARDTIRKTSQRPRSGEAARSRQTKNVNSPAGPTAATSRMAQKDDRSGLASRACLTPLPHRNGIGALAAKLERQASRHSRVVGSRQTQRSAQLIPACEIERPRASRSEIQGHVPPLRHNKTLPLQSFLDSNPLIMTRRIMEIVVSLRHGKR